MALFTLVLPYFSLLLSIAFAIGAYMANRNGRSDQTIKLQKDAIGAMKIQIETLESQVSALEKESAHQKRVSATINYALKQRGIVITIDDDFVSLQDIALSKVQTVAMRKIWEEEDDTKSKGGKGP